MMKKWFSKKTASIRYFVVLKIIKNVTPSFHKNLLLFENSVISVPRPMISFVSALFNDKPLIGAEIGVFRGVNAKSILQSLNVKKLYLIDPYTPYTEKSWNLLDARHYAQKNLSCFKDRIEWVKKSSEDALKLFPDEFFDFVYIDGNHMYDYVKKDLQGYWKKVKKGGILGGHDFWGSYGGVVKAVTEFSKEMDKPFWGKKIDFWFIKGS